MKERARIHYHSQLWPAACQAQGWRKQDQQKRRDITMYAMEAVNALSTDSIVALGDAETTALFTYLHHLAEPDNITKLQRWIDCQADYVAFHASKVADWWQGRAYGATGGRRLTGRRFGRRDRAEGPAFGDNALSRREANQRLMTMRDRAKKKGRDRQQEECPY